MFTKPWMMKDNVYGGTVLSVMLAKTPEERNCVVDHWRNAYLRETNPAFKAEALVHYVCADAAALDMRDRIIPETDKFPGWHTHLYQEIPEPWWNWMKRNLNG